jgi:hypothetical protein
MVRQLSSDGSLTPDVAAHIMTSVLQALQLHGQHEANLGSLLVLGAQLYEILRPLFPNIIEVCAASVFMNRISNHIYMCECLVVFLSARMQLLCSGRTDFTEIWYL